MTSGASKHWFQALSGLDRPPQGNYSDLMVKLSAIFSQLRGDRLAEAQGGSAQVGALPCKHAHRLGFGGSCAVLGARVALLLQFRQHASGNSTRAQLLRCPQHLPASHPSLCCLPQAFKRSTTKYWVRTSDVSTVKRIIIENMPVSAREWCVCALVASGKGTCLLACGSSSVCLLLQVCVPARCINQP